MAFVFTIILYYMFLAFVGGSISRVLSGILAGDLKFVSGGGYPVWMLAITSSRAQLGLD